MNFMTEQETQRFDFERPSGPQDDCKETPLESQREWALLHYEEAATAVRHWSSFVRDAIKAYPGKPFPIPNNRTLVFEQVARERERQDAKWGEQNHTPAEYLMILGEKVGEANKAALEAHFEGKSLNEYRKELIQVAAVAIAMIECFDRHRP